MQPFPHVYETMASATPAGHVTLRSPGVPELATALPVEFDGTGDQWSPETLLSAAIADCFVIHQVLQRAEDTCLITNSLTAERQFEPRVEVLGGHLAEPDLVLADV